MANICDYKIKVKGKKNACYALIGSMPICDEIEILDEYEEDGLHIILAKGDCSWYIDCYCDKKWEGDSPVILPENPETALQKAENEYRNYPLCDRTKMFDVEVWCNSVDLDMAPENPVYAHYVCGVEQSDEECPSCLEFEISLEEGCHICVNCGCEFYEEDGQRLESGEWFCNGCYEEIFG